MAHKDAQTSTRTKTPFVAVTKGIPLNAAAVEPWLSQRTELGGRGDTKQQQEQQQKQRN